MRKNDLFLSKNFSLPAQMIDAVNPKQTCPERSRRIQNSKIVAADFTEKDEMEIS